ncbi:hypothetical protein EYF80_028372 [Liparis tanakae]|uniref:Uncharacterized protein n=1 Tax=Liparis tanakae TaxID=230148 RepID=A0A4Z2H7Y9_9TELE|nr:hypothetical protein EYF80_028372 [Liparis tanakae]
MKLQAGALFQSDIDMREILMSSSPSTSRKIRLFLRGVSGQLPYVTMSCRRISSNSSGHVTHSTSSSNSSGHVTHSTSSSNSSGHVTHSTSSSNSSGHVTHSTSSSNSSASSNSAFSRAASASSSVVPICWTFFLLVLFSFTSTTPGMCKSRSRPAASSASSSDVNEFRAAEGAQDTSSPLRGRRTLGPTSGVCSLSKPNMLPRQSGLLRDFSPGLRDFSPGLRDFSPSRL